MSALVFWPLYGAAWVALTGMYGWHVVRPALRAPEPAQAPAPAAYVPACGHELCAPFGGTCLRDGRQYPRGEAA